MRRRTLVGGRLACSSAQAGARLNVCWTLCRRQGEKFLDSLDDIAVPSVELIDGTRVWSPPLASGLAGLKLWVAAWLQRHTSVTAAATGSAVTPSSNKVGAPNAPCAHTLAYTTTSAH